MKLRFDKPNNDSIYLPYYLKVITDKGEFQTKIDDPKKVFRIVHANESIGVYPLVTLNVDEELLPITIRDAFLLGKKKGVIEELKYLGYE